jgi:hypothetical protein
MSRLLCLTSTTAKRWFFATGLVLAVEPFFSVSAD